MVTAYVMIKAHTGDADRLKREIESIDGVRDRPIHRASDAGFMGVRKTDPSIEGLHVLEHVGFRNSGERPGNLPTEPLPDRLEDTIR